MKKTLLTLSVAMFLVLQSSAAFALNTYSAPMSGFDAGVIDNSNFMQLKETEAKKHIEATKDPAVVEEEVRKKMELLNSEQVSFKLNTITIEKNTQISTNELMRLVDFKIGKMVTINDLIMSANDITDYYQSRGYLSTIAYLPPQKVQNGNITIVILEGKYGKVDITGNKWAKATYLNKTFLKDQGIVEGNVLNVNDIKQSLQNVNGVGYMKANIEIQDNEESEEFSDITLNVKDRFPIDVDLRYDNQGRDVIGSQRGVLYAGLYNVTGHGDRLLGTGVFSSRSVGAGAFYTIPIAKNETKLNLGYSYSHVKLGKQFKEFDMTGDSNNYFIGVSRRLAQGDDYRLYGDVTFDMRDSKSRIGIVDYTQEYKTRALRFTLTDIKDDFYGKWLFNGSAGVGIPLLGATNGSSDRQFASNNFVKLNANVARMQVLPKNCLGIFQLNGQYANRALFASEKMQFGGISSVRGFDEGYYIGDYGLTASLEFRAPVPYLRHVLPDKYKFIDDSIRLAAFYDIGWLGDRFSSDPTKTLMSVGPGVVLKLTKYLSGNFYWGIPIAGKDDEVKSCRFHFTLTSNVL
ncbi:MAG: ShlB/FhaC/HecB family hemolysin secretion/activation protein [Candidatus Gastranaerophilales bacterium]|nr:ShlB/FhaC/HecB family hemolysin secretion/activation protein [Candidatus Gastranaerophilales bacterium]